MKEQVIKYLEDTRDYYAKYHDHKETAAWAGLVLYVLFCGALVRIEASGHGNFWFDVGFTLLVLTISVLVFLYVKNQFAMKDEAAALTAASMSLMSEVLLKDADQFRASDYLEVAESANTQYQASHCLSKKLLEKAAVMKTRGGGAARLTKSLAYLILSFITVAVIGGRWFA